MKKRIALGMITALALSTSVAMASPVEMNEGQFNVNIGVAFSPDTELESGGSSVDFDSDESFYGGVTYGITDKWGIQYDYSHYDSSHAGFDYKMDASEFNILYKLDPHLNAFAGYVYAGMNASGHSMETGVHTDGYQVGLAGWYPLSNKFKTFAKVGIGNNSRIYEIGVSYATSERWDIDISYRDAEYKDFYDTVDMNYDGIRFGLSTSF